MSADPLLWAFMTGEPMPAGGNRFEWWALEAHRPELCVRWRGRTLAELWRLHRAEVCAWWRALRRPGVPPLARHFGHDDV